MAFIFECPRCGQEIEAQEDWGGWETVCPGCNQNIKIPAPPAPETPPIRLTPVFNRETPSLPKEKADKTIPLRSEGDQERETKEDLAVLKWLKIFKLANWRITIAYILIAIFCCCCKPDWIGVFVFTGVGVIYLCLLVNLWLSWHRGMYRNTMQIKSAIQSLASAKKNEKN